MQIQDTLVITNKDDNTVFGLRCSECFAIMQAPNIQVAVTRQMCQLFNKQKRNHIAETTPGWFWCQNSHCNEVGVSEDAKARVLTCGNCQFDSCVPVNGLRIHVRHMQDIKSA